MTDISEATAGQLLGALRAQIDNYEANLVTAYSQLVQVVYAKSPDSPLSAAVQVWYDSQTAQVNAGDYNPAKYNTALENYLMLQWDNLDQHIANRVVRDLCQAFNIPPF